MFELLLPTVAAYFPYAAVTAFTPGPNNFLSLYAVAQEGWRGGKNVLLGMSVGFFCVMTICGVFCWSLAQFIPGVSQILTYIGAAYILWLAWHIATSQPSDATNQSASFLKGMALQFVNVKIYLYAITVFSIYVLPASQNPLFSAANAVVFTLIGCAGFLTWGVVGGLLQKFINAHFHAFNYAMALILVFCAVDLLF